MPNRDLAQKAAEAAIFQRRHGAASSMRLLYRSSFSLLRFFHHSCAV